MSKRRGVLNLGLHKVGKTTPVTMTAGVTRKPTSASGLLGILKAGLGFRSPDLVADNSGSQLLVGAEFRSPDPGVVGGFYMGQK